MLSADYFSIPEEEIRQLESVLTMVGGTIVYATAEFSPLAPAELPVSPGWSPVERYGGYARTSKPVDPSHPSSCSHVEHRQAGTHSHLEVQSDSGRWGLGCDCLAF